MSAEMVPTLSVKERILLYLHSLGSVEDPDDVADLASQESLCEAVDAPRGSVSRALKALMAKGLVTGELAHVPGAKRRRMVYVLSSEGHAKANELEADDRSDGIEFSITNIDEIPPSKINTIVHNIPQVDRFFGRTRELFQLERALQHAPFVMLYGMAGMGKTTLAARYGREIEEGKVIWVGISEPLTLPAMLREIADGLGTSGKNLHKYLDLNSEPDAHRVLDIIGKSSKGENILLILDDLHRARERIITFLSYVKEHITTVMGMRILMLSRAPVHFYDIRDVKKRRVIREMEIEGLDKNASGQLIGSVLGEENLTASELEKVMKATDGHPLALELADSIDLGETGGDISSFILNEVFNKLSEDEKKLLEYMSVFRTPISKDALETREDVRLDALRRLVEKRLVKDESGIYDLHGLIRLSVYDWMSREEKKLNHSSAVESYLKLPPVEGLQEAVHHLIRSGDVTSAANVLIVKGRPMLQQGQAEIVYQIIADTVWTGLDESLLKAVETLREDILLMWGDWDESQELYLQTYLLFDLLGEKKRTLREVHREVGALGWNEEELNAGVANLKKSLEIIPDDMALDKVELLRTLGWTLWLKGDDEEAEQVFLDAVDKVKPLKVEGSRVIETKVHLGMGTLLMDSARYDEALHSFDMAIDRIGEADPQLRTRVMNKIGVTHWLMGDMSKAEDIFSDALRTAWRVNFLKGQAYVILHLGQCTCSSVLLERAFEAFQDLGDLQGAAYAMVNQCHGVVGLEEYYDRAVFNLQETGTEHYLRLVRRLFEEK